MKPIVSIIVPAYNHERFIACCIESVLKQTLKDWEMIVVDDCSTDKTQEIVNQYLGDGRIKYVRHRENYGKEKLYLTHNESLAICKGEFITVLEGDDYWPGYRLEMQLKYFNDRNIVLCHGNIALDKNGQITVWKKWENIPVEILTNNPVGSALKFFLYGKIPVVAQSVMIRKSVMDRIGGFKQIPALYLVDYPTWMEISLYGRFAFIPEVLGYWRRHSFSITAKYQEQLWQGIFYYIEQFILEKKDKLNKLPVNLEIYMKYPGVYALSALYKMSLLKNSKKEAKTYLYKTWKRKKACEWQEVLKICLLAPFAFVPFLTIFYRKYIRIRNRKFSPE